MFKSIKYKLFTRPYYKIDYRANYGYQPYYKYGLLGSWNEVIDSWKYFVKKEDAIEELIKKMDYGKVKPAFELELLHAS